MKLRIKKFAIIMGVLLLCLGFKENLVSVQAASTSGTTEKTAKKTLKSCWVKKNGVYYYYNSKGKLLKNGIYKINATLYHFDKAGKRTSAKYNTHAFYYTFDKKTGKNTSIYTYLTVESVSPKYNSITGSRIERVGSTKAYKKETYRISAGTARIYDKSGKKISCASLKKGDMIKVFTKSDYIKESAPAQFGPITKIRVVKTTAK